MLAPVIQKSDSKELLETFCDLALASIYFQIYYYITSELRQRHFNENFLKCFTIYCINQHLLTRLKMSKPIETMIFRKMFCGFAR